MCNSAILKSNMLTEAEITAKAKELEDKEKELQLQRQQLSKESQEIAKLKKDMETRAMAPSTEIRGTIGTLAEFTVNDDWSLWFERFEQFVKVNDVRQDKQVSLFLTLIGNDTYALLRNLCSPVKPANSSLAELSTIMQDHLNPKPSIITQRYKFKSCRQKEGESVKSFIANIKKLSVHCDFGVNLESNVRDQFVFGLRAESIKKKLLGEKDLTYKKAVELALSWEMAGRDAAEMMSTEADSVNFVANNRRFNNNNNDKVNCECCGRFNHETYRCKYKNRSCNNCGYKGHLAVMCKKNNNNREAEMGNEKFNKNGQGKSRNFKKSEKQNFVEESNSNNSFEDEFNKLFHFKNFELNKKESINSVKPIEIELKIENEAMKFEIDTGSPISAMSLNMFENSKVLCMLPLRKSNRQFKTYQEDIIRPKGIVTVRVECKGQTRLLDLFIIQGNSNPIIGREWLEVFKLIKLDKETNVIKINSLSETKGSKYKEIVNEFSEVFSEKLGLYTRNKFSLKLKEGARPVYCKPRPVPLALREKVEKEIDRLVKADVLEPVNSSEWATPVVPVLKTNGEVRLCGDYRMTVNPQLQIDRHPIPKVSDLLFKIKKGGCFSKLDLSHAYQQVELDEPSQELLTLNTHKGLFKVKRLKDGVASGPGLFQREIDELVEGIQGIAAYFDDIGVSGDTVEEHDENLREVLKRLRDSGLHLSKNKCEFAKDCIQFLGYMVDKNGVHISSSKTAAIEKLKRPENQKDLKSFLGMLNYYSKFVKNYASILAPLYELLRKNVEWKWTKERENAFLLIKKKLASSEVLTHYRSELPLKLSVDASPRGLGIVLAHIFPDNEVKPIAFASRMLTKAEQHYSQIDREALAIVYGVRYFHEYLYGRKFLLETDHKPLIYIFGSKKGVPQMAASRLQRWSIFLAAYNFEIKHIRGLDNIPADFLSRYLVEKFKSEQTEDDIIEYSYLNFVNEECRIVNFDMIKQETEKDEILSKVKYYVKNGWPIDVETCCKPYASRKLELTLESDCIMWGYRIIIPNCLRSLLLDELHSTHTGITRMKAIARSYFWWPGLDKQIEDITKVCKLCLKYASSPPRAELHVWTWPMLPNFRLHADFCGPINGKMYLIIVDAHSKWVDIKETQNITAEATIKLFKEYFANWGLPNYIVTDNGSTFTSELFGEFLKKK